MESTADLKAFITSVLKLQSMYNWMMDCYVLDFFTKDLWQNLTNDPSTKNWCDVLCDLEPKEIGYFLLEMYNFQHVKTSNRPAFRKVWPLNLLAFLATCHSLNLQNQPWTCKSMVDELSQEQASHADGESGGVDENETSATTDINFSQRQPLCQKRKGLPRLSKSIATGQSFKPGGPSQIGNLSHIFRCNVKPKKQHEIEILSEVICKQAEILQCWNIVDVGAGLGHLSRLLSFGCRLRVVTVEGNDCHKSGNEKLDEKLRHNLKKQHAAGKQVNGPVLTWKGSLKHVTHFINADISVDEFCSIVSKAFCEMRDEDDAREAKYTGSGENFIIVGLHTCGDLASTLLRVFNKCESAVGIVSVGCCYMKLSHDKLSADQSSPDINDVNKGGGCKTVGYPMSEYLKSCSSHDQSYNGFEAACHAICRYHKKLVDVSPTLKLHYYRALLELLIQQQYPGSPRRQIRSLRTKKAAKMTFEQYVTSACEILSIQCPSSEEKKFGIKKQVALPKLLLWPQGVWLPQKDPLLCSTTDIRHVEELHQSQENNVIVFYVLRLLLAPLIEGLILVDRLLFIKENFLGINARISLLFDPNLSPRNKAIIADKDHQGSQTKNTDEV